ncbi:ferredoxin reductase [Agitococcus lubricus]|uniref:Ferredoxin-NADP reductase n=1 Tax=Agitococcus lubricus TaxID=1077255 RepID=A0A2T5IY77_9GAMM|nr:ferredoxin reductase [Agitococcus lubricus]PTQ88879.1 ferredoxin-NADP reductase [Agitococcus lubricus]
MSALSPIASRVVGKAVKEDWLDFVFSHVDPMMTVSRVMARVVTIHNETADIKRFVFKPNKHWRGFEAGQFVSFKVMIDGSYRERCYSLVSAPTEQVIEIAVKRQPNGKVSNWLHDELKVGDVLELGDVGGEFVLPARLPTKLLLIAGGSGITPVYSLVVEALKRQPNLDIAVMYYANTDKDLAFANELVELAVKYPSLKLTYALAETGVSGRFSEQQLASAYADYSERLTYLCGPQGLMNAVSQVWQEKGISQQLVKEMFGFAVANPEGAVKEVEITLRRSQQVLSNTKASLLESAEAAGARPVYGCRIGMCKTCSCTKVSGVVRDLITGAIDDQPNTQIRICVTEPLSPVTLDI